MARIHSYARFSSRKQDFGDSTRRQNEGLEKFLREGNHTLSDLRLFDKGKSGFRGNKQTFLNEFLRILRAKDGRIKKGDILYVEAVDRLSRRGIRNTQDVVNEILNSGVDIAISLPLEKIYRADKINDLGDAIELAAFAFAAHVYSDLLSGRLKRFHDGARKRAYKDKIPINSGAPPAWLIRTKDGFRFKDGAKEAIQYIYNRTTEGIGGKTLTRELNEKLSCFGYSGSWNERYMRAILNDRRAIGEFQPMQTDDAGKRHILGEPIAGYYPAAISEEVWCAANIAASNRRLERGPTKQYINLFTGLVFHALDRCPMHLYTYFQKRADGKKVIFRRLKSVAATKGIKGAHTETVNIHDFEYTVLSWLKEIDLSIFDEKGRMNELNTLIQVLNKKQQRINEIEIDEESSVALLAKQLTTLKEDVSQLKERINTIKAIEANNHRESVDYLQRLADMENTPENRQKLREAIKRVVKQIILLPVKLGTLRRSPIGSMIEIKLHNGTRRRFLQLGRKASPAYTDETGGESLYDAAPKAKDIKAALTALSAGQGAQYSK